MWTKQIFRHRRDGLPRLPPCLRLILFSGMILAVESFWTTYPQNQQIVIPFFGDVHISVYIKGKPPYVGVCLFKLLDIYFGN